MIKNKQSIVALSVAPCSEADEFKINYTRGHYPNEANGKSLHFHDHSIDEVSHK